MRLPGPAPEPPTSIASSIRFRARQNIWLTRINSLLDLARESMVGPELRIVNREPNLFAKIESPRSPLRFAHFRRRNMQLKTSRAQTMRDADRPINGADAILIHLVITRISFTYSGTNSAGSDLTRPRPSPYAAPECPVIVPPRDRVFRVARTRMHSVGATRTAQWFRCLCRDTWSTRAHERTGLGGTYPEAYRFSRWHIELSSIWGKGQALHIRASLAIHRHIGRNDMARVSIIADRPYHLDLLVTLLE